MYILKLCILSQLIWSSNIWKKINHFFCDMQIDVNNIPNELAEMTDTIQYNKQS